MFRFSWHMLLSDCSKPMCGLLHSPGLLFLSTPPNSLPSPPHPLQHPAQQSHSAGAQRSWPTEGGIGPSVGARVGVRLPRPHPSASSRAQHGGPPAGEHDGTELPLGMNGKNWDSWKEAAKRPSCVQKVRGTLRPRGPPPPPLACSRRMGRELVHSQKGPILNLETAGNV